MSTITVPTTLTAITTAGFGAPVANQLNQQQDYMTGTVSGTTPGAGTATWVTLGTLTVPTWAATAKIAIHCTGLSGSAGGASANIALQLGSVISGTRRWTFQVTGVRAQVSSVYRLTGISTGSQTLSLQATFVSGTLTSDGTTFFDADIVYLG